MNEYEKNQEKTQGKMWTAASMQTQKGNKMSSSSRWDLIVLNRDIFV